MRTATTMFPGRVALPWRSAALIGALAWLSATAVGLTRALDVFDLALYDQATRWSREEPEDPRVARVYVGDRFVSSMRAEFGRWPWRDRRLHAAAVHALAARGARVLALDMLIAEEADDEHESDQLLAEETALFGPVVFGCLFNETDTPRPNWLANSDLARTALEESGGRFGAPVDALPIAEGRDVLLPIDGLLDASPRVGHTNPAPHADGSVRRVPLLIRYEGRLYPSLALRAVMEQLDVGRDGLVVDLGSREIRLVPRDAGEIRVPVDPEGRLWVHWDRPLDAYTAYGYDEISEAPEGDLEGDLVVVGVTVAGSEDRWPTPRSSQMPGFVIHSQIAENILTGRFVTAIEPSRHPLAWPEIGLLLSLLAGAIGVSIAGAGVPGAWRWGVCVLGGAAPVVVGTLALIHGDVWLSPVPAALGLFGAGLGGAVRRTVLEARRGAALRKIYERYVAPRVLESILANPERVRLTGTRKELTILFADIRGFTPYSARLEPEDLNARLNEYFGAMTEVIHAHEGTLDKFLGDAILVFFGDPLPQDDHAVRAVRAALAMQDRLARLRDEWTARGIETFEVGMGIATGYVTVGSFGSHAFADYTVIGNTVNLASRLSGEAAGGDILLSARTYHAVKDDVACESLGERELSGIDAPQEMYRVGS